MSKKSNKWKNGKQSISLLKATLPRRSTDVITISARNIGTKRLRCPGVVFAVGCKAMFFLPNILCVHVRKLGTSVGKSTTKSDLHNFQNRYQSRSGQTSRSFVIQRRDTRDRSHSFCLVASLVHACMRSLLRRGPLGSFSLYCVVNEFLY